MENENTSKKIKWLKEVSLKEVCFDYLCGELKTLMRNYPAPTIVLNSNNIYRARKNKPKELFLNVSDLLAPKSKDIEDKYGRANQPGKPVLYASDGWKTTFSELGIAAGDWVTIMNCECKSIDLKKMIIVPFGIKSDDIIPIGKTHENWGASRLREVCKQYPKLNLQAYTLVNDFLNEQFCKYPVNNNWEYKITAGVASMYINNTCEDSDSIDAICYPNAYRELNFAFNTESFKKFYNPVSFEVFEILELKRDLLKISVRCSLKKRSECFTENGNIIWND